MLTREKMIARLLTWVDTLSQPRVTAVLVFVLALAVRLTYNLTVERGYVPLNDAALYDQLAQHMLQWHCFCINAPGHSITSRSPVYPLFLAGIYLVSGHDPLHARLALSVVGSITCVLTSMIAGDLFGRRAGLVAGLIAVTYPQLFIWDAFMYSESLAICFFAASCLMVMRTARDPSWRRWLLVGGFLGLTALVRPNGIYVLIAVVVWMALAVRAHVLTWRQGALNVALCVLACAVVLAPWTIRNAVVTDGAFVPLTSDSGDVLAGAYNDFVYSNPGAGGGWVNPGRIPEYAALFAILSPDCWGTCEIAANQFRTQFAEHWALTHLSEMPRLVLLRLRALFTPASPVAEAGMPVATTFARRYPKAMLFLTLIGLIWLIGRNVWRRKQYEALIPILFAATVVGGAIVFYGSPRMRAPMEPLIVAFATGALAGLWSLAHRILKRASLSPASSRRSLAATNVHPEPASSGRSLGRRTG